MNDDNVYHDLPEDPEHAFLLLERRFREECLDSVRRAHQDENVDIYYVDYIAQVLAAISELGLTAHFDSRVPKIEEVNYNTYLNFSKDVKHYRTMLEIRHGRRSQGYSVRFDTVTKKKIQHYISLLRAIFEKLEVGEKKKEALLAKLADLQSEADRDRTRYEIYAALTIETAGIVGETVEKSKILDVLDGIARVFWGAKTDEVTKRLPPPAPTKRIEPPRPFHQGNGGEGNLDDEIPF